MQCNLAHRSAAQTSSARPIATTRVLPARSVRQHAVQVPGPQRQQHLQSRLRIVARADADNTADGDLVMAGEEPESCQDAIELGLKLTSLQRWNEALELFEKALTLPGTGVKRFRDKPRGASDREKMTCLYNIACCHSQLGDVKSGLVALAGCLELGYADFPQIRRDTDLAAVRKDERFEQLMRRFEPQPGPLGGLLGGFFGNKK